MCWSLREGSSSTNSSEMDQAEHVLNINGEGNEEKDDEADNVSDLVSHLKLYPLNLTICEMKAQLQ